MIYRVAADSPGKSRKNFYASNQQFLLAVRAGLFGGTCRLPPQASGELQPNHVLGSLPGAPANRCRTVQFQTVRPKVNKDALIDPLLQLDAQAILGDIHGMTAQEPVVAVTVLPHNLNRDFFLDAIMPTKTTFRHAILSANALSLFPALHAILATSPRHDVFWSSGFRERDLL
jgi:hypothetical protein